MLSYIADIIDALSLTAFVMLDVSFDCLLERTLAFDIKRLSFFTSFPQSSQKSSLDPKDPIYTSFNQVTVKGSCSFEPFEWELKKPGCPFVILNRPCFLLLSHCSVKKAASFVVARPDPSLPPLVEIIVAHLWIFLKAVLFFDTYFLPC